MTHTLRNRTKDIIRMLSRVVLLAFVLIVLASDSTDFTSWPMPASLAGSTLYSQLFSCPTAIPSPNAKMYLPFVFGRQARAPSLWAASGMERVDQNVPASGLECIQLYAARGEYEPFQIVVRAEAAKLTNVNIALSDLYGPNNSVITRDNITLYREHYVYVSRSSPDMLGSNRPLGVGWYPDALIPFVDPSTGKPPVGGALKAVPFSLDLHKNQPIWVDVFVPRNAPAGDYVGTFIVNSDQGSNSGLFRLHVWNIELPLKPSLNSSFEYWDAQSQNADAELLKHKLMPKDVDQSAERELIDRYGLASGALKFFSGVGLDRCQMHPSPSVDELQAAVSSHQPDLFLYNHTADEIDDCPGLYDSVKQWARNLHAAGVANLITMAPVPELYDDGSGSGRSAVDIWVVLPKMYDNAADRIATVLGKGDQVWSYNAQVQDSYSPKWQIDFAPINYRIQPGFISQSLGLTGILYWRVDLWTPNPWADVQTYKHNGEDFPGEGMLVYPGQQVGVSGVVPSMRLKWLREGVDDYEYVELLKKCGHSDDALSIARSVGPNWKSWTKDPDLLEAARRQLGEALAAQCPSAP